MRFSTTALGVLLAGLATASVSGAAEPKKPIGVNEPGVNRSAAPITVTEEGVGSDSAKPRAPGGVPQKIRQ